MNNQYTIQSGDTLSGIAQQKGTNVNEIMKLNPSISDPNKISAGANIYIPNVSATNTQVALPENRNIDIQNVANKQQPVNIPEQSNTDLNAISNSAQNVLAQLYNLQAKQTEETLTQQQRALDPLYQQQEALQNQILNRGQEQLRLEQEAGIDTQSKALAQLQGAIAQQSAKFIGEQYNLSAAGNPITASVARKNDAMQLALMTASAQSMTGNLQAAQQSIDNAINLKYTDTLNALQFTKEYIARNEDIMSSAQKSLAETRSKLVDFQIKQIEKEQDNFNKIIMEASASGAPSNLLNQAILADSSLEAAAILRTYSKDYWNIQQLKYDMGIIDGLPTGVGSSSAQQIASAIAKVETNGGLDIRAGASGELASKYQYLPETWDRYSQEYNKAINGVNQPIAFSNVVEDAVTVWKVQQWLDKGYNGEQIAAMWNGGEGAANDWQTRVGVNKYGVAYSVPAYVDKFNNALGNIQMNSGGITEESPEILSWAKSFVNGDIKITDVPQGMRSRVISASSNMESDKIKEEKAQTIQGLDTTIKTIDSLLSDDYWTQIALQGLVGPVWTTRLKSPVASSAYARFLGDVSFLINNETLNKLVSAKQGGATFGALSDSERVMLQNSATKLGTWAIKDGDTIKGFKVSEKDFLAELNRIKELASLSVSRLSSQENTGVNSQVSQAINLLNTSTSGQFISDYQFAN